MALGDLLHRFIGRFTGAKQVDGKLRCAQCRREIAGLSVDTACPECGEMVLSSVLRGVPAVSDDAADANHHPSRQPFEFVRKETGYPVDAYLFIADVLMRIRKQGAAAKGLTFSNTRHVTAVEMTEGLREFAVEFFGDNTEARDVLRSWNIQRSEDVAEITRCMVAAGLLAAGAHDPAERFSGLFTLESLFGAELG